MDPMTREELADWLRLRCVDEDLDFFLNEYGGKTEHETEKIHAELHGEMA